MNAAAQTLSSLEAPESLEDYADAGVRVYLHIVPINLQHKSI